MSVIMLVRLFSQGAVALIKRNKLPPRPKFTALLESECTESFVHGGRGPGGQKINKTSSKVQLKHLPSGIVVTCQATRSREKNREIAREKMALELERLNNGVNGISERDRALRELEVQNKKSKARKSKEKHDHHRELKEIARQKELFEEEEIVKKMKIK